MLKTKKKKKTLKIHKQQDKIRAKFDCLNHRHAHKHHIKTSCGVLRDLNIQMQLSEHFHLHGQLHVLAFVWLSFPSPQFRRLPFILCSHNFFFISFLLASVTVIKIRSSVVKGKHKQQQSCKRRTEDFREGN